MQGLALKLGKKVEQLSLETQSEFKEWKEAIERVLGIGGVEELLSEDEEKTEGAAIEGMSSALHVCDSVWASLQLVSSEAAGNHLHSGS